MELKAMGSENRHKAVAKSAKVHNPLVVSRRVCRRLPRER